MGPAIGHPLEGLGDQADQVCFCFLFGAQEGAIRSRGCPYSPLNREQTDNKLQLFRSILVTRGYRPPSARIPTM